MLAPGPAVDEQAEGAGERGQGVELALDVGVGRVDLGPQDQLGEGGGGAPHLPEAGVRIQLRDPALGPFDQVAQRLHPGHQPRVEHHGRPRPRRSHLLSPAFGLRTLRIPILAAVSVGSGPGGVATGRPGRPGRAPARRGRGDGAGADVVGQGAVGEEGGAAQDPQLAGVEAAEGRGEERRGAARRPGSGRGRGGTGQDVPDDRLGDELALAGAQPVGDAEPLEGPAGGRAEPPGRGQQDGHAAVGDAVPLVGDPEQAGVGLRLLGGARVAGGLHGGGPAPGEGDDRAGPGGLEAAHGVEPGAAEAPAALEQDHAGAEALGPCRQRPRGGAAEGVGGARRVAGQDRPGAAPDQQREQAELGRVELLGLVDQDRVRPGRRWREDVGAILEQVAGLKDEAGLVDRVLKGEMLAVEGEEGRDRDPAGTALGRGPLEQVLGAEQAALAGEHELGQLVGEGAGVDQRRQRAPVDLTSGRARAATGPATTARGRSAGAARRGSRAGRHGWSRARGRTRTRSRSRARRPRRRPSPARSRSVEATAAWRLEVRNRAVPPGRASRWCMVASSRAVLPLPGPPRMTTLPGGSIAASSPGGPSGSPTGPAPGKGADDRSRRRGRAAAGGRPGRRSGGRWAAGSGWAHLAGS